MDLRARITDAHLVDTAKALAVEGLLTYQPLVFSDDFEVGVGYEFETGSRVGLVHYPDIAPALLGSPELRRLLVDPADYAAFHAANRRLADYYDYLADRISEAVGGASGHSFLDVGCNVGYFPQSFAARGAKLAAGCDRQDFSRSFDLLNAIEGRSARYLRAWYEPDKHALSGLDSFDVVMSMAMVCHVADPLHLLAAMGKLAQKAIFVWTLINDDAGNTCHYGDPRGDYPEDDFPYCFDNKVAPSESLMRYALELMGFKTVSEIAPPWHNGYAWQGYRFRGFLGLR
jgi:SAM-dependent methyltransferase